MKLKIGILFVCIWLLMSLMIISLVGEFTIPRNSTECFWAVLSYMILSSGATLIFCCLFDESKPQSPTKQTVQK